MSEKILNEKVLKILRGNAFHYPHNLEQQFPRVLARILELWGTPELDPYLTELMMDTRDGKRKGFPAEVASEILRLSLIYAKLMAQAKGDIWGEAPKDRQAAAPKYTAKHLLQASELGNTSEMKLIISSGVNLESLDERNWTPLIISAFNGKEDAVLLLILARAKIDAQDLNGYSAIHWAAFNGHDKVVKLLLSRGAQPNSLSKFGWTPLMQAATRGHILVTAQLIEGGANPNVVSTDRWTALHKASANGHAGLVRLLLSKGADPKAEYRPGGTALTLAMKGKHIDIMALLTAIE